MKSLLEQSSVESDFGHSNSLSWKNRYVSMIDAFFCAVAYSLSFIHLKTNINLWFIALIIGVSSGLAWLVFGMSLLMVTKGKPSVRQWFDNCLDTMSVGIFVLAISVVLNLMCIFLKSIQPFVMSMHLLVLAIANIAMLFSFIFSSKKLGLSPIKSLFLWLLFFQGSFLAISALFINSFGISSQLDALQKTLFFQF